MIVRAAFTTLMSIFVLSCQQAEKVSTLEQVVSSKKEVDSDPFRWMELEQDRLKAHLIKMNSQAEDFLGDHTKLKKLESSIIESLEKDRAPSIIHVRGNKVYFLAIPPGATVASIQVFDSAKNRVEIVLNPNQIRNIEPNQFAINDFGVSADGRYIAYALAAKGREVGNIGIYDTQRKVNLEDKLTKIGSSWINFLPDSSGFLYRESPNTESADVSKKFYGTKIKLHRLGRSAEDNPTIFDHSIKVSPPLSERDFSQVIPVPSTKFFLGVSFRNGPKTTRVFSGIINEKTNAVEKWENLYQESDDVVGYEVASNRVFVIRNLDDSNLAIDELKPHNGVLKRERTLKVSDVHFQQVSRSKNGLVILARKEQNSKVFGVRLSDLKLQAFSPPTGTEIVNLYADHSSSNILLRVNSWTHPTQYWSLDDQTMTKSDSISQFESEGDSLELVSESGYAISHDGVEVPYSLVKRRGLIAAPSTPVMIRVYAAFGISYKPRYDRSIIPWLKAGGMLVYCHARGGGEKGPSWHKAGQGPNKINSMLDTVACAEHLVKNGLTSSQRLVLSSGSAGGIISNWIIVNRPELFAAVVTSSGLGNISRIDQSPSGVTTQSEHGDPKIPEQKVVLEKNDAYLHVKPNNYPACLYLHGFNDSRVPIWMSSKIAARLSDAQKGSSPVLMMTDFEYGHGLVGVNIRNQAEASAKMHLFLGRVLSVEF